MEPRNLSQSRLKVWSQLPFGLDTIIFSLVLVNNQLLNFLEEDAWQRKEEQRLRAIQRLQEKYQEDAAIKAEKMKAVSQ